ncbi:MAG TPA: chromosome segregation protein SMC [Nitrosarchaeum sp.]|nr:chromosome segregation protein SMC [Nitrosarchaeum sp.]
MDTQKHLTKTQIINKIQDLIETNNGDVGRLYHILEFLKQDKSLYQSDQKYLENKLSSSFIIINDEKPEENQILPKIQTLINLGSGDPGRLQHIYDVLSKNKALYHSDQVYLEQQLESNNIHKKNTEIDFQNNIKIELEHKNKTNVSKEIIHKPTQITPKLRGLMPKDWNPPENNLHELTGVYEKIKTEEELLNENKKIHDEINIQRSKLSQIILNRKEYEKQVALEKSILDSEIKEEHLNIQAQTKLSEQILLQKNELEKVKSERIELMKKIESEKDKVSKELEFQKNQLLQTRKEQEEIEKQIKDEQDVLSKMLDEQKTNLFKQSEISRDIKEKQTDLEKTKKEFEEISSQVSNEKTKLVESEKLKKLIKSQENDLNKAKKERLKIDNTIAKEKEHIAKKTKEEQEKLKMQVILAKQLADEKMALEEIKQKREKIQIQIKSEKQKLKDEQQKIKKQINKKNTQIKPNIVKSNKLKTQKSTRKQTKTDDLNTL